MIKKLKLTVTILYILLTIHCVTVNAMKHLSPKDIINNAIKRAEEKKKQKRINSPGYNDDTVDFFGDMIEALHINTSVNKYRTKKVYTYMSQRLSTGNCSPPISKTETITHPNTRKRLPSPIYSNPEVAKVYMLKKMLKKTKEENQHIITYHQQRKLRRSRCNQKPDFAKIRTRANSEKRHLDSALIKAIVRSRAKSEKKPHLSYLTNLNKKEHIQNAKKKLKEAIKRHKKSIEEPPTTKKELQQRSKTLRLKANLKISTKLKTKI